MHSHFSKHGVKKKCEPVVDDGKLCPFNDWTRTPQEKEEGGMPGARKRAEQGWGGDYSVEVSTAGVLSDVPAGKRRHGHWGRCNTINKTDARCDPGS